MTHIFLLILLGLHLLIPICHSTAESQQSKILSVGEELKGETLQLKFGQRLYKLVGLREKTWYEVKISYPASIPATFSIELKMDTSDRHRNNNRRLLNTEKLIFKAESTEQEHILIRRSCLAVWIDCMDFENEDKDARHDWGMKTMGHFNPTVHILVTVNAEGVVAQSNVQERELVLFNIVCDELMLGVPRFTWWVGLTAILCLLFAFLFPLFFPLRRFLEFAQNQKENSLKLI